MPKLAPVMIREQGADGTRFEELFPCSVDARSGSFSLTVSQELMETARHMQQTGVVTQLQFSSNFKREVPHYYIHCDELDHLKRMVSKVVQASLETTMVREPVIRFVMSSTCHYWEMPDGSILPNGGYDPNASSGNAGHPDRGYWSKANPNNHGGPYGISIYAKVEMKETHTNRSGKVTHKYVGIDTRNFPDFVGRLNGFTHMLPPTHTPLREMPYTDEAGEFFFHMVNGMCLMAQRMHSFFGDDDSLQKAIEHRANITPRLGYFAP